MALVVSNIWLQQYYACYFFVVIIKPGLSLSYWESPENIAQVVTNFFIISVFSLLYNFL